MLLECMAADPGGRCGVVAASSVGRVGGAVVSSKVLRAGRWSAGWARASSGGVGGQASVGLAVVRVLGELGLDLARLANLLTSPGVGMKHCASFGRTVYRARGSHANGLPAAGLGLISFAMICTAVLGRAWFLRASNAPVLVPVLHPA